MGTGWPRGPCRQAETLLRWGAFQKPQPQEATQDPTPGPSRGVGGESLGCQHMPILPWDPAATPSIRPHTENGQKVDT